MAKDWLAGIEDSYDSQKKTTSSQDSETSPKKRQNTSKVSPKTP